MKYTLTDVFTTYLKIACSIVGRENFDLVCFTCDSGKDMMISAGDINVGVKIKVPDTFNGSKESKTFCLSGSKIKPITKLDLEELSLTKKEKSATFKSGKSKLKFGIQSEALSYEPVPLPDEKNIIGKTRLKFSDISKLKDRAVPFCTSERNRFNLSCISFQLYEGALHCCATDGKRFAWQKFACDVEKGKSFGDQNVLIHPKVIALLTQMSKSEDCEICLYTDGILFTSGDIQVFSRASEGNFPPTKMISTDYPNIFKLEQTNVLLDKAMLLCNENTNLSCNFKGKKFIVESTDTLKKENQLQFESFMDFEKVKGSDNIGVVLNAKYLSQGVKALGGDLFFGIKDAESMVAIFDKEDFNFIYAIMPVKQS